MVTPLPRILAEEVALQSRDARTSPDALGHPICWLTPILYWQGKQHNSRGDTLCPRSPGEAPPMGAAWFAPSETFLAANAPCICSRGMICCIIYRRMQSEFNDGGGGS